MEQSMDIDGKKELSFDASDPVVNSARGGGQQNLSIEQKGPVAEHTADNGKQSLAFNQGDHVARGGIDKCDKKIERLSKRRNQKLEEVNAKEKILKEMDRTDPMYADKKKKIKEEINVLIIEESSFDNQIRLLKEEQSKQKEKQKMAANLYI